MKSHVARVVLCLVVLVLVSACTPTTYTQYDSYQTVGGEKHHIRTEVDIDGTPAFLAGANLGEPESWSVVGERRYYDNKMVLEKVCHRDSDPTVRTCAITTMSHGHERK